MDDSFFRVLNEAETEDFIQWARDGFKADNDIEIDDLWHPVVRHELERLKKEAACQESPGRM